MHLLKVAEVAARLNCSPSKVYQLMASGALKHNALANEVTATLKR